MKYNTISLFSGAMGLDLGLEKAGMDVKVCVEYNKWACETIRKNKDIPVIQKDINEVTSQEILDKAGLRKEEVFLIAGGPPCQAFSTAGKRRALEDFRGNVIVKYLNIIEEIQPKFFIMENVRGLLSAKLNFVPEEFKEEYDSIKDVKGSVLYFLKSQFEKYGYTISFALFNSANYGIPQKRERIIIFGNKGDKRIPLPSPTHSSTGLETGKAWSTIREAFKGLKEDQMHYIDFSEKQTYYLKFLKEGEYWRNLPQELQENAMGAAYHLTGGRTGFYRRLAWDEPSPTLVTSPRMPATMLAHPVELRPLSIEEYARIQQFPDDWVIEGKLTEIYKQIGNAVPVGMGYMAGKNIINFFQGNYDVNSEKNNNIPYSRYKNTIDYEFIKVFNNELKKLCITV